MYSPVAVPTPRGVDVAVFLVVKDILEAMNVYKSLNYSFFFSFLSSLAQLVGNWATENHPEVFRVEKGFIPKS